MAWGRSGINGGLGNRASFIRIQLDLIDSHCQRQASRNRQKIGQSRQQVRKCLQGCSGIGLNGVSKYKRGGDNNKVESQQKFPDRNLQVK